MPKSLPMFANLFWFFADLFCFFADLFQTSDIIEITGNIWKFIDCIVNGLKLLEIDWNYWN